MKKLVLALAVLACIGMVSCTGRNVETIEDIEDTTAVAEEVVDDAAVVDTVDVNEVPQADTITVE